MKNIFFCVFRVFVIAWALFLISFQHAAFRANPDEDVLAYHFTVFMRFDKGK